MKLFIKKWLNKSLILSLVLCLIFIFVTSGCKKKPSVGPYVEPPVEVIPEKVEIKNTTTQMYCGEELKLEAKVYPDNASQDVVWELASPLSSMVYELNGNILKALKEGVIIVKCSSKNNQNINDTITITVLHELLELDEYKATEILCAPGEDASTSINIHYQIKNTKSYALITKSSDENFEQAFKAYGKGRYFEDLDPILSGPFEPRNVWHIKVEDLEPNTEYIYKINNGDDTYSDVYRFKTAGNEKTSFIFLADVHYSMLDNVNYPSQVSETTINKALELNPNISFIMGAGDLIDTGGNDQIWKKFFSYAESLKKLPFAFVPGNHEYYINGTGQRDNAYFNVYSPLEQNGPGKLIGSSAWFKHNDTLFIMVDNVKNISYDEQIAWMCDLLENQEYKYSVICFHIPVNFNNGDYDANFLKVFDKYSVDLVLSGHYHSHSVHDNLYEGSKATLPNLGTTYLTGYGGGAKGWNKTTPIEQFAKGYIIDITDECINIKAINANGDKLGEWNVSNNRPDSCVKKNKDEIMNSISYTENLEDKTITFNWMSEAYGNVKKIEIEETLRGDLKDYSVLPSEAYTSIKLTNYEDGRDYAFKVTVTFTDGTKQIKEFAINKHISVELKCDYVLDTIAQISFNKLDESIMYLVRSFDVYANGFLHGSFNYLSGNSFVTSYSFEDLKPDTSYEIELIAKDGSGKIIFKEKVSFKTME